MDTAIGLTPTIPAHFDEEQRAIVAYDTDKGGVCVADRGVLRDRKAEIAAVMRADVEVF